MSNTFGSNILTEGLVFNFDGGDISDNPQTGNVVDGVGGKVGVNTGADVSSSYAPTFDGSDDRIDFVSGSVSNDFAFGTDDFTIESWFRYTGANFDSAPYIIDMRAQGAQSEQKPTIYIWNDKLQIFANNGTMSDGSETMTVDTWFHLVVTRIGSTRYVYLNNTQTNSDSHTLSYVASRPRLGARSNLLGAQFWNGNIPIVRIYKGKGFTAEEVSNNYNAVRGRFGV